MAEPSPKERSDSSSVPWVDAVGFIQQLSHDLRNHLNAIELQSAYISELEGDANLKGEVNRLREMISGLTSSLQRVSGVLAGEARIEKNRFLFTLREPKIRFELSTKNWGREPLRKVSHGHYGLGLNRVRTIVEAHGGELHAQYDPKSSALVTALILPLSREKA